MAVFFSITIQIFLRFLCNLMPCSCFGGTCRLCLQGKFAEAGSSFFGKFGLLLPPPTSLPSRKPVSALILQRTSSFGSFNHDKFILFKNDYMFRSQRATITKTEIKYNAVQIMLVVCDPI